MNSEGVPSSDLSDASGQMAPIESIGPIDSDRAPAGARGVLRRALYWLPVFAAMLLFAQVSFLGLRPALCEGRRLGEAELLLRSRWQRDVAMRDRISAHLQARADPIFRERQRRLREGPGAPLAH
jgi:hypothetical protein